MVMSRSGATDEADVPTLTLPAVADSPDTVEIPVVAPAPVPAPAHGPRPVRTSGVFLAAAVLAAAGLVGGALVVGPWGERSATPSPTATVTVPGPVSTVTVTAVPQPGPTTTVTATAPASPVATAAARTSARPASAPGQFGDGSWTAGSDVAPGTYRATPSRTCRWVLVSCTRTRNGTAGPGIPVTATLRSGDTVSASGCGTWQPVG